MEFPEKGLEGNAPRPEGARSREAEPLVPADGGAAAPPAAEPEEEARRCLAVLGEIVRQLPVGIAVQADDGRFLLVNDAAAEQFGVPGKELIEAPPGSRAGQAADRHQRFFALPEEAAPAAVEERLAGPGGERTLLTAHKPVLIREARLLLSASFDISDRKQLEEELSRRAYFDELTGLPNRALIEGLVRQALGDPNRRFALAFLDIDNFKHVNDYYNHAIGDALLVKVAQRIVETLRPSDMLARMSGDEFLLLLDPLAGEEELAAILDNLLDRLKAPFAVEGFEIFTSASVGVSIHPDHGRDYEALRRNADSAMYQIKSESKGGAAIFDSRIGRSVTARMELEQRLRLAVRDGRFRCAFQPKVDILTQEVVGVEALIRLIDEDGEIYAPGSFIELAVELGLIDHVTHMALDQIVSSIDLLNDAFGPAATLSINIAAKQACDLDFMRSFVEALDRTSHAQRFMVEVTEDAFVAKNFFQKEVLPILRKSGVRVSIDDFGTGYSSLSALADITADEIKIDRSFISGIHQRSRSQSVLRAIESLGDALGMTVVAEGVETFEELAYLRAASRIRFAQGYHFARPLFFEDFTLARRAGQDGRQPLREPAKRLRTHARSR